MSDKPSAEREAEIRANHELGERIFDDTHCVHVDRRDLLAIVDDLRAELANALELVAVAESMRAATRAELATARQQLTEVGAVAAQAKCDLATAQQANEKLRSANEVARQTIWTLSAEPLREQLAKVTAERDEASGLNSGLEIIVHARAEGFACGVEAAAGIADADMAWGTAERIRALQPPPEWDKSAASAVKTPSQVASSPPSEHGRPSAATSIVPGDGATSGGACLECTWADGKRMAACAVHRKE